MRFIIAGGTGFIGSFLSQKLKNLGHEIIILTRTNRPSTDSQLKYVKWDAKTGTGWSDLITSETVIVNLAGSSIAKGRWTDKRKKELIESRVNSGKAIVDGIKQSGKHPKAMFQASAVGYYGTSEDLVFYEDTKPEKVDFLSNVCQQWENSTQELEELGVRRIVGRIGIALWKDEGALPLMALPVKLFVGGKIGSGNQWISWIHIYDLVNAIIFLCDKEEAQGVYNLVAPNAVINSYFMKTLAKTLRRPYWFPTPSFMLILVLGEKSSTVLNGQRVFPKRLIDDGFEFQYPTLEQALRQIYYG